MAHAIHAIEEAMRSLAADSITMAVSYRMNRIPTLGLYTVTANELTNGGASHLQHMEGVTSGVILMEVLRCVEVF